MNKIYFKILICVLLVNCSNSKKTHSQIANNNYPFELDSLELFDKSRNRKIPVALYYPKTDKKIHNQKVVIFSHGYGENKGSFKEEKVKILINFFKGIAISISTLVPGVSGGTMAIILGVYDDLIHAIGSFFENWKRHSILILEIGFGGFIGILLFSPLLEKVISNYPIQTGFLFIGVVLGGIPVLYKRATCEGNKTSDFLFLIIGLLIALSMAIRPNVASTMATAGGTKSFIFLIIAGIVIAVALILPGISGAFMLLILGLYDVTLKAINTLDIPFLIPLSIGVLIGTIATTKTIEKMLKRYPGRTYMLILGFVLGSILPIYPGMPKGINIIFSLASLAFGFFIIFFIGKKVKPIS